MKRRVGFLTFSFLFISILGSAQENCPEGFRFAGALSGTGSSIKTFDKTIVVNLPEGATLDESYQQTNVRATNGKRKAQSDLRPLDIPKGIHITPIGSSDVGKVWAVSEPKLMEIKAGNGTSTRYAFGMHLFCSVPSSPYSQIGGGGCDVAVKVCFKPKRRN